MSGGGGDGGLSGQRLSLATHLLRVIYVPMCSWGSLRSKVSVFHPASPVTNVGSKILYNLLFSVWRQCLVALPTSQPTNTAVFGWKTELLLQYIIGLQADVGNSLIC